MALYNETKFRESLPAGYDGYYDWDFLEGALPRGIMPMDVDASVEIKRNILDIEPKDPNVPVPLGQKRALAAKVSNGHSVIFQWGKRPSEITKGRLVTPYEDTGVIPATAETIYRWVSDWGSWADANPFERTLGTGFTLSNKSQIPYLISQLEALISLHGEVRFRYEIKPKTI